MGLIPSRCWGLRNLAVAKFSKFVFCHNGGYEVSGHHLRPHIHNHRVSMFLGGDKSVCMATQSCDGIKDLVSIHIPT